MKEFAGDLLAIARGPFLLLTPAVLFPAVAASYRFSGTLPWSLVLLILIAGVAAHVAVNALNEYQDFNSGLDKATERTPFSGGSGTLPAKPGLASSAKWLFVVSFALMVAIGAYLSWRVGPKILSLGLVGGLIILVYTRWINRMPMLCLVSPGVGFGLLMVNGSGWLLTGSFIASVQVVAWIVFSWSTACCCSTNCRISKQTAPWGAARCPCCSVSPPVCASTACCCWVPTVRCCLAAGWG